MKRTQATPSRVDGKYREVEDLVRDSVMKEMRRRGMVASNRTDELIDDGKVFTDLEDDEPRLTKYEVDYQLGVMSEQKQIEESAKKRKADFEKRKAFMESRHRDENLKEEEEEDIVLPPEKEEKQAKSQPSAG